jgi:hypothetical protein
VIEYDPRVQENAMFKYEITRFKTAAGQTSALVALGGGPMTGLNATPVSLGGHFAPVGATATPSWSDAATWRNVIQLGVGYEIELTIDTMTATEEDLQPGALPRITTYAPAGHYMPTNPDAAYAAVFFPAVLKALVKDTTGSYVQTTFAGDTHNTFLDPKILEPAILPVSQYGNSTYYELGAPDAGDHWIGVSEFGGLGYWTLSYIAGAAGDTPLGRTNYEVGYVATDTATGFAHSIEIVNREMLAWMTNPADPLVEFKIELTETPSTEVPVDEPESESDDSPGFEFGLVLFSLASVAVLVVYHKRK